MPAVALEPNPAPAINRPLCAERAKLGLGLEQAARNIGISKDTLSRAEGGASIPQHPQAKKILDYYNFERSKQNRPLLTTEDFWPDGLRRPRRRHTR